MTSRQPQRAQERPIRLLRLPVQREHADRAGLDVVKKADPENAANLWVSSLTTEVPMVLDKTHAFEVII